MTEIKLMPGEPTGEMVDAFENATGEYLTTAAWKAMREAAPTFNLSDLWRPIESAPKDGRMFLVLLPRMMNLVVRARYNTVHKYFITDCENEGRVSDPIFFFKGDMWMEIPEPPKEVSDD